MSYFDVFNGDADGICSLHQLRLADPHESHLITGVKRDIALLGRVPAQAGDVVTVLDLSADVNCAALLALLDRGVTIRYFDHHGSGQVPAHPGLHAFIDTTRDVCTGIIVDRWLGGAYRSWAVVAAFGDNFRKAAGYLAQSLKLDSTRTDALRELGECLNYNGYGDTEADLIMHPSVLYERVHRYADPFAFIANEAVLPALREARRKDLDMAQRIPNHARFPHGSVVLLPDAAWSRRVRGTYGNFLANLQPTQAHAILVPNDQDGYTVSVRAPLVLMAGADGLCRMFPGGGGRAAAAGIDHLPAEFLPCFIAAFEQVFG